MAAEQNSTKIEEETTDPILCIKKCGFFGSRERMNLCSKCYRDHVAAMEKQAVLATATANANANDDADKNRNNNDNSAAEETTVGKKRKRRCFSCAKRVGLTAFNCRCGETFCSLHRLPEQHDCSYDYKTPGREAIAKANPVVKRSKIEKI